jgi:hypothetical protein
VIIFTTGEVDVAAMLACLFWVRAVGEDGFEPDVGRKRRVRYRTLP